MSQAKYLNYQVEGTAGKPALLLLNSLGTNLHMWDAQMDALAPHFQVVRMDTRGHGRSFVSPLPFTLADLGQDVLAVMDELELEHAHVCGISMGGLTALWMGIYAPQRIHKLVVANSAAKIGTAEGWLGRATQVLSSGAAAMQQLAQSAPQRWFTTAFTQQHPLRIQALCEQLALTSPQGYAACCKALADADLRMAVHQIQAPLCVIAGNADPVTTTTDARYIVERAQHSHLVELDASHLSNVEQAEAFNTALIQFLSN